MDMFQILQKVINTQDTTDNDEEYFEKLEKLLADSGEYPDVFLLKLAMVFQRAFIRKLDNQMEVIKHENKILM